MQSMTGFGRGVAVGGEAEVSCEIRAVNARSADVRIRLPQDYRAWETELRGRLARVASRGKVEVLVERRSVGGAAIGEGVDEAAFRHHRGELLRLEPALRADPAGLALALLRLPGVIGSVERPPDEAERAAIEAAFARALDDFLAFREREGDALAADLSGHVAALETALSAVEAHEAARERRMRERLERLVAEKLAGTAVDRARLEQECLYFLDKMDIAEEKARLAQHCAFFRENLADAAPEKGRRLGFIAQEMGREINTLGAKAYSSDIQRVVVAMKEALEKIKEQLANAV